MAGNPASRRVRGAELSVSAVGIRGDGVAELDGAPVFVPFAAPGDRLRVSVGADRRARIEERLADGPDRVAARCPHFERCGGCAVQHLADKVYREWKSGILRQALERRGLDPSMVEPLVQGGPGRRRRARLHFIRTARDVILGFHAAHSREVVQLDSCPVLTDRLAAFLPSLRAVLSRCLDAGERGEGTLTDTETGLDLTIIRKGDPDLAAREELAGVAARHDLARISWKRLARGNAGEAEPVAALRAPVIRFGDVPVALPPDGFVQPTAEGETALRAVVQSTLPDAGRVLDLFSGCGAFALPAGRNGLAVHAVERDPGQIAALTQAARQADFGERVTGEVRDLDRRPLLPHELEGYDVVIIDPPRAGAGPQVEQITRSAIPAVVYASCNPASFAHDAATLVEAGYTIERIRPVDQFLWTPHLELAGVFTRA